MHVAALDLVPVGEFLQHRVQDLVAPLEGVEQPARHRLHLAQSQQQVAPHDRRLRHAGDQPAHLPEEGLGVPLQLSKQVPHIRVCG